jgi:hypothetical protein
MTCMEKCYKLKNIIQIFFILMYDYTYTCVPLTNTGSGVHAPFEKGMVKK